MAVVRVVWGTGSGPTAIASYDAALAAANIHNYNLVTVSSVIPAGTTVNACGTAPELGPAGEQLTVVEGCATLEPGEADPAVAGLGWAQTATGLGIFYETGGTRPERVREQIAQGLAAGRELRDWEFDDDARQIVTAATTPDEYTTAVVLAVYGDSTPVM